MQIDWCDVPRTLPLILRLVLRDVAELDKQLREGHFLLRRLLRVEDRWRGAAQVLPERLLAGVDGFGLEPVSLLILGHAQAPLHQIRVAQPIVQAVHMGRELILRTPVVLRDHLVVEADVLHPR